MPGLKAFLQKTMIFTAASPADLYGAKLGPSDAIVFTKPVPTSQGDVADRPVFHWTHDPSAPAKIANLAANVRAMNNMTMQVCDSIEVERVAISVGPNSPLVLPLDVDHVVAKFKLDKGHIPDSTEGWWRLEANTDWSMAVVFAYEISGSPTAPELFKVTLSDLEKDSAFPTPPVRRGDPDYMDLGTAGQPADAGPPLDQPKTLENTVTAVPQRHFVVIVFGFTTTKERGDFEPGGVLGAGRIYPHVMVLSSRAMVSAESTIHIKRPAQGMTHDGMDGQIGPLLATDANEMYKPIPFGAVPLWSNVFDYVVANPLKAIGLIGQDDMDARGSNWMTVVDPTKKQRTIIGKIQRETDTHVPDMVAPANFTKLAMQGEFDNLHLAPGMIYAPPVGPKEYGIKMAPFCVHDCFHTHFRWGSFLKGVQDLPKSDKGFIGRIPYGGHNPLGSTGDGMPLVPFDQTVKIGLTGPSTFRYFAETTPGQGWGSVYAGTWTVFNHHGSGYALGITSETKWQAAGVGVAAYMSALLEPVPFFDPIHSIPAFYFRLRWTGRVLGEWVERLQIVDLSSTTGVRS